MRKEYPKPWWIWQVNRKQLSYQLKHFYSYFCWFGPHTNYEWNCRLAKRFGVSRSTIKRWLKKLRELRLIWITSGGGPHRRIHTHYYSNLLEWYAARAIPKRKDQVRFISNFDKSERVRKELLALKNF